MTFDRTYIESKMGASDFNALKKSDGQISTLISEASNEVDSYLLSRYKFPYEYSSVNSSAESEILRMKYIVFRKWLYAGKYDDAEMEAVQTDYSGVIKKLNLIVKGENDLPGLVGINANVNASPGIIKTQNVRKVFYPGGLRHYDN